MNILLVNHYGGSKRHGMEYRPFYLAREWVRLGHQVSVAAASFSHLRQQAPAVDHDLAEQSIEGIRYVWLRTPYYYGNGPRRALNIMTFVWKLLRYRRWLARNCRPHAVIASSTYPLDIVPAYRLAKTCGAKLVYEVHDLWPLSPIELGDMSPRHPFIMLMQWAENFAYRKADRVVSVLPLAESHMRAHGLAEGKFVYIPNGTDPSEWQLEGSPLPDEHRHALARLREEGHFVVGYAGGHGVSNALDTLVEAAPLVQQQSVAFVLVGQGPEKDRLRGKATELGLTNTVFLPAVPKQAIPALLASLDALYIGWNRKPIYRFGICPNKLLDYMMSGKPIIHAVDAGNDPVAESGCGVSCLAEDPAAVADAVLQLINRTPAERKAMGRRGKDYVMLHHDYSVLARRFLEVMA